VETHCNRSVPGWDWTRNRPGNLDTLLTLNVTLPLSCLGGLADGGRSFREVCRKLKLHSEVNFKLWE